MSSCSMKVDLEAERKARIRAEIKARIMESARQIKTQLQSSHENNPYAVFANNIQTKVHISDDSTSGYSRESVVSEKSLQDEEDSADTKRDEFDFSSLMHSVQNNPTKLELELDSWVRKVKERKVASSKANENKVRVLTEISKIIQSSTMDIEDKIKSVKMRASTYLREDTAISDFDNNRMQSNYLEYCAMCEMLGVKPTEKLADRVEKEVERMKDVLYRRKQDEYAMGVIEEILEDLGCHVKDDAVLDNTVGQMYSVDGYPLCDVFVGNDSSGIMFEPIGDSRGGSLEHKRRVESSANHVCSLYDVLEKRAAEKGVILKRVYSDPARIDEMCMQSDITERKASKKRRRASIKKQQTLD